MENKYTPEEIVSNINKLKAVEERLVFSRKSLNQEIRDKRNQIKYWLEMNENQLKIF